MKASAEHSETVQRIQQERLELASSIMSDPQIKSTTETKNRVLFHIMTHYDKKVAKENERFASHCNDIKKRHENST